VVKKISKDIFPYKQLSEHAEITKRDNTEDLREKSKAEKTTNEQKFTINYTNSRVYCDYKCSRLSFFLPILIGEEGIFIFISDVVDASILDDCNRKI